MPGLPWEEAVGAARAQQPEPTSVPGTIGPVDTLCQHRPVNSSGAPKVPVEKAADSPEPRTIPHSSSPIRVKIYPQQQKLGSRHPSPGNRSTDQQLRPIPKTIAKAEHELSPMGQQHSAATSSGTGGSTEACAAQYPTSAVGSWTPRETGVIHLPACDTCRVLGHQRGLYDPAGTVQSSYPWDLWGAAAPERPVRPWRDCAIYLPPAPAGC
uniref:Uncharacterized protein n=1 Tax=Molossus molossus TaxID=27622 RepID=A0A7J8BKS0_MOLMO|nr:hypothetical protein HJG59_010186 [Molossus molossus]